METLVCNLLPQCRQEVHDDREYLVADGTMIVPGVLNGSNGPLYYSPKEVKNSVPLWDSIPLLVNHPVNGKTEEARKTQGIGQVKNSRFEDGRLRASFWFDAERTKQIDTRIYDALVNNQQIELSTGLNTTNEKVKDDDAVFNSPIDGPVSYTYIARDYKPDHLAILPDQIGACSIRDGCGVNNKLSETDVKDTLRGLLNERFMKENVWIEELFANEVVFSKVGQLHKLGYTRSKDTVSLSNDEPRKVQRVTSYKVINVVDGHNGLQDSTDIGEPNMATKKLSEKQRETVINELITNSCCWEKEDREELVAMTDNQLRKTKEAADKQVENEEMLTSAEAGFNDDRDSITYNQEKKAWERITKPQNDEQATPQLSQEDQDVLNYGRRMMDAERKNLIDRITKNVEDNAKPEIVANFSKRSLEDLRQIADLMPQDTVSAGQGQDFYGGQPSPDLATENEKLDGDEALVPEDIDFVANSSFSK